MPEVRQDVLAGAPMPVLGGFAGRDVALLQGFGRTGSSTPPRGYT